MPKTSDSSVDHQRLITLCEAALEELRAERTTAKAWEVAHIDDQIEAFRDMLHWARSKH
jgi:hypothetical protein